MFLYVAPIVFGTDSAAMSRDQGEYTAYTYLGKLEINLSTSN